MCDDTEEASTNGTQRSDIIVAVENMSLRSVQHRKKGKDDAAAEPFEFDVEPTCVCPENAAELEDATYRLGRADVRFTSNPPTAVELLAVFSVALAPDRFIVALQRSLKDFAIAAGRREGDVICGCSGVRFSAIRVADEMFITNPVPNCFFDSLQLAGRSGESGELLTIRIITTSSGQRGALALSFDHALCDIAGAALFLSHISAYCDGQAKVVTPNHERERQELIINPRVSFNIDESKGGPVASPDEDDGPKPAPASEIASQASESIAPAPAPASRRKKNAGVEGGVACVEWVYTAAALQHLKAECAARSRHDAVFADILLLLSRAGHAPLATASISRDDRNRVGLPLEHFGNGAILVEATLPSAPAHHAALASAVRAAVESTYYGNTLERAAAHVHLNTWWHPLQRQLDFGAEAPVAYAFGPDTLAKVARLCVARGGQPNVTVLPAAEGGIAVSLVAPLKTSHGVLEQLRKRAKAAKSS